MFFPKKFTVSYIKQAYQNGEFTPTELIEEIIKRSEKYSEYNVWIVKPSMELIKNYIANLPENAEDHPLWGIPFAIKDNINLKDVPTTAACPEFSYVPKKSASVVQKLINAGAIPIGKTNLDQFATGLVGTRSPYGEVHNAHDEKMISGGSSSGSAVAVALGMAAFSLGTDTAGSGRVPAMLNTIVGYKPSLGAWSTDGVVPACASLDCVTVFANNLEDTQIVNKIVRGFDENCRWSKAIELKGKKLPEKIYLPKDEPIFFGAYSDNYRTKWNNAAERIKNLGIKIEYIDYDFFYTAAKILYEGAYVAERWLDLKEFVEKNPNKTFPVTEIILRSGAKESNTAAELFKNLHDLQNYRHKASILLKNSVMIMPTAGGSFTRDEVRENPIETNSMMGLYTNHCNLLNLSAIAIPENSTDKNLPFGITIFGLSDSENLVIEAADKFLDIEYIEFAVCGLHKKGYPLEYQLSELGAEFLRHDATAKKYKLFKLNTSPVKPGLIKSGGGESIEVDIYRISKKSFGIFSGSVLEPLVIGTVELADGSKAKGFLCEQYAVQNSEEITDKKKF